MQKNQALVALCLACSFGSNSVGAKERRSYEAAGPWAMEYADNACRLVGNFKSGDSEITIAFQRFDMDPLMTLGLAGSGLQGEKNATKVTFRYAPAGEPKANDLLRARLQDGRDSFLIRSTSMISQDFINSTVENWRGAESFSALEMAEDRAAASTKSIILSEGFVEEVEINLGSMAGPVKAIRACAKDLVKSWGIDPQAVASMSRLPEPVASVQSWITVGDYPAEMARQNIGGWAHVLVTVSPQGVVEDCHFQVEQPGLADATVCRLFKGRGRFLPALDEKGQPMRSYWKRSVKFGGGG